MVEIVKKFENGKVVECVHCEGTGVCKKSTRIEIEKRIIEPRTFFHHEKGYPGKYVHRCDKCGEGIPDFDTVKNPPGSNGNRIQAVFTPPALTRPTCKVCGGVGSVRF